MVLFDSGARRDAYVLRLNAHDCPVRGLAMEIMRHSDVRLTAKTYTDAGL
jgi:hypothetical protein